MQAKGGAQDRDSETMTSTLYYTCMYVCLTILCVVMCITVHNAIHSANEGYANVTMSLFLMEELRLNFVYNNLTPRSWHKMHVRTGKIIWFVNLACHCWIFHFLSCRS